VRYEPKSEPFVEACGVRHDFKACGVGMILWV